MERLVLQEKMTDRPIYGMDNLGQGRSWPIDCQDGMSPQERGVIYSGDTWIDQAIQFLEQVVLKREPITEHDNDNDNDDDDEDDGDNDDDDETVQKKVHLVGNSVGGHLAVFLAALRPDLVESVCLLNATPVWGLNLPGW